MIEVKHFTQCLILGTGMLQDVREAQLGGSLDSLGLQLLLRPETKSYTRFCPGGFPQCPRPASCCWTDHLWEKQSFAEGGDVMVLKWLCWWYTPGVNEGREWIDWWLTTKVRCFCSELNEQMSRLAWNNSKSVSSRINSPSLQCKNPRTDLAKYKGTDNCQARMIGHNAHIVCQFKSRHHFEYYEQHWQILNCTEKPSKTLLRILYSHLL